MVKRLPNPMSSQHYNKVPMFTIILPSLLPFSYRLNVDISGRRGTSDPLEKIGTAPYFILLRLLKTKNPALTARCGVMFQNGVPSLFFEDGMKK
jgi:hypothetical protein